jgi:hypothetical protein
MRAIPAQSFDLECRRRSTGICFLQTLIALLSSTGVSNAESIDQPGNVEGICDNSFLIEEAYNQEPGVVQHIFTALYQRNNRSASDENTVDLSFTQEWPVFSQAHQFSYTMPYSFVDTDGIRSDGVGDLLLNYRYQAYFDESTLTAFAPRLSLILPTGDADRGFGDDTVGYQVNLPFSTAIGDKWFAHLNAGSTFLPHAASANQRDLWHFNLGASAIHAITHDVHLMLEWIANWEHTPYSSSGRLHHEFTSLVMPGARRAFNFANGSQLVAGLGIPVGLTDSTPEIGVFLYLSFEHRFLKGELDD